MKQKLKQQAASDVEGGFLSHISLWNIYGNSMQVRSLRILAQAYLNDKAEGRNPQISHVLFVGNTKGTGKRTLAYAYSNSLGCSQIIEAEATSLSMGVQDVSMFLQQGDSFSSYLIHNATRLSPFTNSILVPAIKDNQLKVCKSMGFEEPTTEYFNKLVMFCCNNIEHINPEILRKVSLCCHTDNFTDHDILNILLQRLTFLNWSIKDGQKQEILETIVSLCNCNVGLAIRMLGWMYKCSRSMGEDIMSIRHLNMALHLLQ